MSNQPNQFSAIFTPESVVVTGLNVTEKEISHEDFLRFYSKTQSVEVVEADPVLLPSNCILMDRTKARMRLNCYYPSSKKPLIFQHSDNHKLEIITPNIIISYVLLKGGAPGEWILETNQPKYFCTPYTVGRLPKDFIAAIDRPAGVYLMPFSNTYEGGNMCFGNNTMPRRFVENNLRGLDYYYAYMWETPFNSDLGIKAASVDSVKLWYTTLEALAKKNLPFPYRKLRGFIQEEAAPPIPGFDEIWAKIHRRDSF